MPSVLPTENTQSKAVDTWGIGTYDSQRDEEGDHGENSEAHEPAGRTTPDDATKSPQTNDPEEWLSYPNEPESRTVTNMVSADLNKLMRKGPMPRGDEPPEEDEDAPESAEVFSPDRALAYPDSAEAHLGTLWHNGFVATAEVPGDIDGNFQHFHPKTELYDARVESSAGSTLPQEGGADGRDPGHFKTKKKNSQEHSELPSDADNPAARTDYYDYQHPGHSGSTRKALFSDYIAPTEDSGAYTGQGEKNPEPPEKKKSEDSKLPGVMKNEETMEDWLGPLGNYWSGKEIEDVSGPYGFPATDFNENLDFDRSDHQDGGTQLPGADVTGDRVTMFASGRTSMTTRQATNIHQVIGLTKDFLKEVNPEKDHLTKRHVLAFLQGRNLPQYLSSDIIRCLKIQHDIHVKDVLDEFPVARKASVTMGTSVARAQRALMELEFQHIREPEVASVLRRCAANLTRALIDMERLETGNG
jgi:hypothetical protein